MMADEEFKLDFDKIAIEQRGGWAGNSLDWIGAFGRSAVESIPELVGVIPSEETIRWRNQNPWTGLASEMAGMAVPYGGWLKAARGIKALEGLATGIKAADVGTDFGKLAFNTARLEAPFTTAAKAEAVRLVPFEVSRLLASQAIGDKSLGEMSMDVGLNLALGAGVSGSLSKLGAMGKVAPAIRDMVPGLSEAIPGQVLLRELDKRLPEAPELAARLPDIELRVRGEVAPKGTRHVDPNLDTKGDLESLFTPGVEDAGRTEKKRLLTGSGVDEFQLEDDWMNAVRAAGVEPPQAVRLMQFPRVVSFNATQELEAEAALGLGGTPSLKKTTDAAIRTEKKLLDRLAPVGDGWLATREPGDGMYVMARKIAGDMPGEQVGKPLLKVRYEAGGKQNLFKSFGTEEAYQAWLKKNATAKVQSAEWGTTKSSWKQNATPDDKWIIFKTDKPGEFVKNSQGFMNTQVAMNKWIVGTNALERFEKDPGLIGEMLRLQSLTPFERHADAAAAAGDPGRLTKWWQATAPKAMRNNEATQHGVNFIKTFAAPADRQFRKSVRGSWVMNQARMINEGVDTWVQKALQGELTFKGDRAVFSKVVNVPGAGRPIEAIIEDLDKEGLIGELMRLQREGVPLAGAQQMVAEGRIRPRTLELATELRAWREAEHSNLNKSEELVGSKLSGLREDDYGLPRSWQGEFQRVVREEGGAIVGVAAGGSAKAADRQAQDLAKALASQTGRPHRVAEAFTKTQDAAGLPSDIRLFQQNPGGMLQNRNIRGFKWDLETPTKNDLLDEFHRAYSGRGKVVAKNLRDAALTRHIGAIEVEDPVTAKNITTRFNQMSGGTSEFDKLQNKLVDRALGPIFGTNTATKIVQATNTGMVHLQLGAFKLSYPLQNIIGVVQSIMPEIAFRLNAAADDLIAAQYFGTAPAVGAQGAVGSISALSPMKLMGQAMRMAWKPSKEERAALEWALNNRVLDGRVGEEFIGQNRRTLTNWKGALSSPRAFGEFALALSEWMPLHSERFARVIAFNAAYKMFKDVVRIADEDVLRLQAKRFVERTNYMYSAADRPLAFTTPIGSAMGLFKTWQMNFIYHMAEYANLGFNKGVWSPLMWQTLGTAAVGGAAATPLYWAADGASKFFADKTLVQYAYDDWQGQADGIMFGLPAALTGVSLSGLMTSPGANPVKDATQLFSMASWTRMKEAGGAVQAAMDNWRATGQHPATDPDVRNALVKAFSPVLLQRAMSIDDEGTIRNISTGLPSAKGLSFYDRLMYQAGLNPVFLERQMAASDALYHDKEKMKGATAAFGDALAEAIQIGDGRGVDSIIQRMIIQGVDVSNAFKSANSRQRLEQKTSAERLARPEALVKWQNVMGQ